MLIRTVLEVHLHAVLEANDDQPIVHDLTSGNFGIHDIEEACFRPLTFFPVRDLLASSEEIHRRLNSEIPAAKGELKVELTDAHLRGELANNAAQIEVFGDAIH